MLASFAFFVMARAQLAAKFRPAMVLSSLVVLVAGYHYLRIYQSWDAAYVLTNGIYVATGHTFNDACRYVDWLITVPLLVAEFVAVTDASSRSATMTVDQVEWLKTLPPR